MHPVLTILLWGDSRLMKGFRPNRHENIIFDNVKDDSVCGEKKHRFDRAVLFQFVKMTIVFSDGRVSFEIGTFFLMDFEMTPVVDSIGRRPWWRQY